MRGERRRLPSRKIPYRPHPERTYVNEDVMPQPLRREVNVDEMIIEAQARRAKTHPKVAHDYNPFGNQDKIAEPRRKAVFKPSKLQTAGYDANTMKDKPDVNFRRLGEKKVERPQIYLMRGEDMVETVASRYYEKGLEVIDERESRAHEAVVDTFHRKTDNPHSLHDKSPLERSQQDQARPLHNREAQSINEKGVQTYRVLTSYTVEVDRDGIEQNIYDARSNAREVNMDQAYAARSLNSGVRAKDESNLRPEHSRDPSQIQTVVSREVDGRIRVHDESQFNRGWDEYEKEQAQLWAEGPIWNVKTSSYEPQYQQEKKAYRDQDLRTETAFNDAKIPVQDDLRGQMPKKAYRDQDLRTEVAIDEEVIRPEDHLRGQMPKKAYRDQSKITSAQYDEAQAPVEYDREGARQYKKEGREITKRAETIIKPVRGEVLYDYEDVEDRKNRNRSRKEELSVHARTEIYNRPTEEVFDGRTSVRTKKQERIAHRSARKEDPNQFAERVEKSGIMPEDEFHDYMKSMNRSVQAQLKHVGDINPINDWREEIERERISKDSNQVPVRTNQTWSQKVKGDRGAEFQERSSHGRNHGTDMVLTAGIVHDSYQERLFGDQYYNEKEYRNQDNHDLQATKILDQYIIPRDEQYYSEHERGRMNLEGVEAIRKDKHYEEPIREAPSNVIKAHVSPKDEHRDAGVEPIRYDTSNVRTTDKIKKKVHKSKYSNRQESKKERHGRFKAHAK